MNLGNKNIDKPKEELLQSIHKFKSAINARRYSGQYEKTHIADLSEIEKDLIDIEFKLSNI